MRRAGVPGEVGYQGRGLVIGGIADPDLQPPLARPLLTWGGGGQHFIFMKTYKLDNTTSPATPTTAPQYLRQCEIGEVCNAV